MIKRFSIGLIAATVALMAICVGGVRAATESVLYKFCSQTNCSDGAAPDGGVIADANGNLYGTTTTGGAKGRGTVFRVAPDGTYTVLYSFCQLQNCGDGYIPYAGLIADDADNLYGTTTQGGDGSDSGTVFKLAPDGTYTVLYSFAGGGDGGYPEGRLVLDGNGNLYGTTVSGGDENCGYGGGCGTVFKVAPDGTHTVLYSFAGSNGRDPVAGLVMDTQGNLYGAAYDGGTGCNSEGCGLVFRIAPDGTESVIHAFQGGSDGANPFAGLLLDSKGNLYGTTQGGGGTQCFTKSGCGVVFQITKDGQEKVLYSFKDGADGAYPEAALIADRTGNLYGTTRYGGSTRCWRHLGCGTAFRLTPDGTETVLYAFRGSHGVYPEGGLVLDRKGKLYGATSQGGTSNGGTVFEIK